MAELPTGHEWSVPKPGYLFANLGDCRGCTVTIAWWLTPAGRRSPHDRDGTSHFATCPEAASFRRPRGDSHPGAEPPRSERDGVGGPVASDPVAGTGAAPGGAATVPGAGGATPPALPAPPHAGAAADARWAQPATWAEWVDAQERIHRADDPRECREALAHELIRRGDARLEEERAARDEDDWRGRPPI